MKEKFLTLLLMLYRRSYSNYFFFRFYVWMKDRGYFEQIHTIVLGKKQRANNKIWLEKNIQFFKNLDLSEMDEILKCLEDEKSKLIYKKVILFRTKGNFLEREYYSLKNQYFPTDLMELSDGEVFVDCGAYIGDTIQSFLNMTKNNGKSGRK